MGNKQPIPVASEHDRHDSGIRPREAFPTEPCCDELEAPERAVLTEARLSDERHRWLESERERHERRMSETLPAPKDPSVDEASLFGPPKKE